MARSHGVRVLRWVTNFGLVALVSTQLPSAYALKPSQRAIARERHDTWIADRTIGHGRSLLQDDAMEAPAPGPPLPLPPNPAEVCTREVLRNSTRCPNARKALIDGKGADEECCRQMSTFYSNASKQPSRNCFCEPGVWAAELRKQAINFVLLGDFFDACRDEQFTVGDEAIAYFQDGAGPCAGLPPAAKQKKMKEVRYPPKRSFGRWLVEALPANPWLLVSFVVAIPSAVGFCIMMWPFVFHAVLTLVEAPGRFAAKKAA